MQITAGLSFSFSRKFAAYPASTWTLEYILTNRENAYTITTTANAVDGFDVAVLPAETATYAPGEYSLIGWVSDGTDKILAHNDQIRVWPDPTQGNAIDQRSKNRRILEAIQASIEKRATHDQLMQSIGGRTIQRHSIAELTMLESRYQYLVDQEDGKTSGMIVNISTRFGRPQ